MINKQIWWIALVLIVVTIIISVWLTGQSYFLQKFLRPIIRPIIQTDYSAGLTWFNPLNAQITMHNVKIYGPASPADKNRSLKDVLSFSPDRPILATIKKIVIDIDLAPLAAGRIYFPLIKIDQPLVFWRTDANGQNPTLIYLGRLLFSPPPEAPPPPLPNFTIRKLAADDLKLIGDPRQVPRRSFSVEIDNIISRSRPEDWPTRIRIRQNPEPGQSFELEARANLFVPVAKIDGQLKTEFLLEENPYLWDSWLDRPASGQLQLAGDFSLTGQPNCRLKFEGKNISLRDEIGEVIALPVISGQAEFSLGRDLLIQDWLADQIRVRAEIGDDNSLNLASIFKPEPPPRPGQGPPVMSGLVLSRGRISQGQITLNRQLGPADSLSLDLVEVTGTIDQAGAATRFNLSGHQKDRPGTTLKLNGSLRLPLDGVYLDTELAADQVPLTLGPLFWGCGVLPPLTGALAAAGSLQWQPGLFSLKLLVNADDCRVNNPAGFRNSYLLKTDKFSADLALAITKQTRLVLDRVVLTGPTLILEINPAGKTNLMEIFRPSGQAKENGAAADNFFLTIDSITARDGDLVLADHKYAKKPFIFRLTRVQTRLTNLTNQPSAEPFKFDLHGSPLLSPNSLLALRGQIDPATALDLTALFTVRNLRLITLEPYLTKDAADFSKTVLDLSSRLDCHGDKLSGANFISLKNIKPVAQTSSNLVFGVPARTVFNFLKNTEGKLEFSFNTSGTIDHPQFDLAKALQAKLGARIGEATGDTGISVMSLPSTILGLPNFLLKETGKMLGVEEEEE